MNARNAAQFEAQSDEFWTALAEGDAEVVGRYIVASLLLVLLVLLMCCLPCCMCHSLCYTLERTCCVARGFFRQLRRIGGAGMRLFKCLVCCSCLRRPRRRSKRTRPANACFARQFNQRAAECAERRIEVRNQAGEAIVAPFCRRHWKRERRRHAVEARDFEALGSKYVLNMRFRAAAANVCREVRLEVAQAAKRQPAAAAGWLYLFRSSVDEAAVPYRGRGSQQCYFFKIGMTRKERAIDRVREWDDAVFENKRGVGYWRVEKGNVLSAEQLAHALLINERYVRFNRDTDAFEIEWFLTTRARAVLAIETVVAASDNYAALASDAVCKKFE